MKRYFLLLAILNLAVLGMRVNTGIQINLKSEPYGNALYTLEAGDVYQFFENTDVISNTDICNNLISDLVYFGRDSLNIYKQCDQVYYMLGSKHPLIEGDEPTCYTNMAKALCNYEIEIDDNRPHSNDLREFITVTLAGCINVRNDHPIIVQGKQVDHKSYFDCPSLNKYTGMVEDEEQFCRSMEQDKEYLKTPTSHDNVESDSDYELYSFVGKNVIQNE